MSAWSLNLTDSGRSAWPMATGLHAPNRPSDAPPRNARVGWFAALRPVSEMALLSHSPCAVRPGAGHETPRVHYASRQRGSRVPVWRRRATVRPGAAHQHTRGRRPEQSGVEAPDWGVPAGAPANGLD